MFKYIILFIIITTLFTNAQDDWNPNNLKNKFGNLVDTMFVKSIHPSLPDFHFRYREYFESGEIASYLGTTFFRVDVYRNDVDTVLQIIESSSDAYFGPIDYEYGYADLRYEGMFIDYNFDNYLDIRFKYMTGANAYSVNQFYEIYLYNPATKIFEINWSLFDLCNPTPFFENKLIRSYYRLRSFGREGDVDTFIWQGDSLKLMKCDYFKIVDENLIDSLGYEECEFIHLSDYYKNNKVIQSDSTIIKIKNIPENLRRFWHN